MCACAGLVTLNLKKSVGKNKISETKVKIRKMANIWVNPLHVEALIEIWADEKLQDMLSNTHRNKEVFESISEQMNRRFCDEMPTGLKAWSLTQCRNKIKSLKRMYNDAKKLIKKSGSGANQFRYFEQFDKVLADKPSTEPSLLLDTSYVPSEDEADHSTPDSPAEKRPRLDILAANAMDSATESESEVDPNDSPIDVAALKRKLESMKSRRAASTTIAANAPDVDGILTEKTNHPTKSSTKSKGDSSTSLEVDADEVQTENTDPKKVEHSPGLIKNKATGKKMALPGSSTRDGEKAKPYKSAPFSFVRQKKKEPMKDFLEVFAKMEESSLKRQEEMDAKFRREEAERQQQLDERLLKMTQEHEAKMKLEDQKFQMQMMAMQREMMVQMCSFQNVSSAGTANVNTQNTSNPKPFTSLMFPSNEQSTSGQSGGFMGSDQQFWNL